MAPISWEYLHFVKGFFSHGEVVRIIYFGLFVLFTYSVGDSLTNLYKGRPYITACETLQAQPTLTWWEVNILSTF